MQLIKERDLPYDILATSRNGNKLASHHIKVEEPTQPIQINIFWQSNS